MQNVHINQFSVSGLTIRTNNHTETDSQKAKIGALWQDFSENLPATGKAVPCYGVYSNFESDENGDFDLTAGIKGTFPAAGSSEIIVPAGPYLFFKRKGALPAAVIELWQEIWQFFADIDAPQRLFRCDFEHYPDMNSVEIYIGIKEGKNE